MNDLKLEKIKEINTYYNAILSSISQTADYEIYSWQKQEEEARLYLKTKQDPKIFAPLLYSISTNRKIDFDVLVEKVVQKADIYWALYGEITGLKQLKEDEIKASDGTKEALDKIIFDYDLEGFLNNYQIEQLKTISIFSFSVFDEVTNSKDYFVFNKYDLNKFSEALEDKTNFDLFLSIYKNLSEVENLNINDINSKNDVAKSYIKNIFKNEYSGDLNQTNFLKAFDTFSNDIKIFIEINKI